MGPEPEDRCPYKKRRGHRDTHRGDSHEVMDAETRVMQPHGGNACGHQELEEARKDSVVEPSEGARTCRHLNFGLLPSRAGREQISMVLSHPVCGHLWQQPQEHGALGLRQGEAATWTSASVPLLWAPAGEKPTASWPGGQH